MLPIRCYLYTVKSAALSAAVVQLGCRVDTGVCAPTSIVNGERKRKKNRKKEEKRKKEEGAHTKTMMGGSVMVAVRCRLLRFGGLDWTEHAGVDVRI